MLSQPQETGTTPKKKTWWGIWEQTIPIPLGGKQKLENLCAKNSKLFPTIIVNSPSGGCSPPPFDRKLKSIHQYGLHVRAASSEVPVISITPEKQKPNGHEHHHHWLYISDISSKSYKSSKSATPTVPASFVWLAIWQAAG